MAERFFPVLKKHGIDDLKTPIAIIVTKPTTLGNCQPIGYCATLWWRNESGTERLACAHCTADTVNAALSELEDKVREADQKGKFLWELEL